jgi:probable F420-dependent oxidoreductase
VLELARLVAGRGFDSFFLCEHTCIPVDSAGVNGSGIVPPWTKRMPDPYISLAAVAATTGLEIGTAVALPAEHEPIAQAKAIATLDQLSDGRFVFGVGWGWNREEFEACTGVPAKERVPVLREKLDAMRRLWQGDEAEYHGDYVNVPPTWSWPKPARIGAPPVLLGIQGNDRNFRRIVEWADGWIPMADGIDDTVFAQIVQLRRMWTETGRDPDALDVTIIQAAGDRDRMRAVVDRAHQLDVVRRILVQVRTEDMPRFEQLIDAAAVPPGER